MDVVITLNLSSYDINTITHLVCDDIITIEEALQADCIMKLSARDRLGWLRMSQSTLKLKVS